MDMEIRLRLNYFMDMDIDILTDYWYLFIIDTKLFESNSESERINEK